MEEGDRMRQAVRQGLRPGAFGEQEVLSMGDGVGAAWELVADQGADLFEAGRVGMGRLPHGGWLGADSTSLFGCGTDAAHQSTSGQVQSTQRERVGYREIREAREVAVGGPKHSDAVIQAKRRDPSIVYDRALQLCGPGDPLEGV